MAYKKIGLKVVATEEKIENVMIIMTGEDSGIFEMPVSLYMQTHVHTTDDLLTINAEVNEAVHEVEQKMAELKKEKELAMKSVEEIFEELDKNADEIVEKILNRIFSV